MLYSASRPGSLLPELTRFDFRKTALGLTAAVAMLGSASMPAAAQQVGTPFTDKQCRDAVVIITDVYKGFIDRGGLSSQFTNGVNAWTDNGCQGQMETVAMIENDKKAFGEIRLRIIAMRTQASAQPVSFSR